MMINKLRNLPRSCFALFGVSACILLTTSCKTTTNMDELSSIPVMEDTKDNETGTNYLTKAKVARNFLAKRAMNNVPTKTPDNFKVMVFDGRYRTVDYYHFRDFNKWFRKLLFNTGLMSGIEGARQNLDCDNYAMLYKSVMGVSSYKGGDTLDMAVAVVVVRQVNEWGGIPGTGGLHMVNLVFTNRGWYIYEPQTNKFILLEDYPNQEHIKYMIL